MISKPQKIAWSGTIISIQPRISMTRSFDQRYHGYHGYVLRVEGVCGENRCEFLVAVGKGAHDKYRFCAGMKISGNSVQVEDHRLEVAEFYRTSGIMVDRDVVDASRAVPPFGGIPPDLQTYRARGHRRLDARTYSAKCMTCIWGCRMPVVMIIDQWNPSQKRYRFEAFCYGPKSCRLYRSGPTRKVPGRKGMVWEEEDWVDEDAVAHRGDDD